MKKDGGGSICLIHPILEDTKMKKETRNLIIILGTGISVGLSYWLFVVKGLGKEYTPIDPDSGDSGNTGGSPLFGNCEIDWPLRKGSGFAKSCERDAVKDLQRYLNRLPSTQNYVELNNGRLVVDGLFGSKTEAALYRAINRKELTENEYRGIKTMTLIPQYF